MAGPLRERQRFDRSVSDSPRGELVGPQCVDEVRPAGPETDVLDVSPGRARRRRDVGVEDGELVALVLEEPRLGVDVELEPVRGLGVVAARGVVVGHAGAEGDHSAGLVRLLCAGVLGELRTDRPGDYHQTERPIASSTSSASQKPAERYFQPPSARTHATTPSSSSSASRSAAWMTAPDETPPKNPSLSSRRRSPATDSSFDTRSFRSSFETSRIGGT